MTWGFNIPTLANLFTAKKPTGERISEGQVEESKLPLPEPQPEPKPRAKRGRKPKEAQ